MIQVQAVVHMSKEAGMQIQCNRLEREDASDAERVIADSIEGMHRAAMTMIVEAAKKDGKEAEYERLLRPDEIDAAAVRSRCEAAQQMISDLCQGRRSWTMSIPARRDYDPDLIISAALADIPRLLEMLGE